jgi:hypothetical protein
MSSDKTPTLEQTTIQPLLAGSPVAAATRSTRSRSCFGNKFELYKTGQYCTDRAGVRIAYHHVADAYRRPQVTSFSQPPAPAG